MVVHPTLLWALGSSKSHSSVRVQVRETSRGPDLQASAAPPFLAAFELEAALVSPLLFLPHILSFRPLGGETEAEEEKPKCHFFRPGSSRADGRRSSSLRWTMSLPSPTAPPAPPLPTDLVNVPSFSAALISMQAEETETPALPLTPCPAACVKSPLA